MIDWLKSYFCGNRYLFSEGDIAFKNTTSCAVVVRICKRTTIDGKPAYRVMHGLDNGLTIVLQDHLTLPAFTKGCLVNLTGLTNPVMVLRPSIAPMINGLQGYKVELLNSIGVPYDIRCTEFHCARDFRNVDIFNDFNKITKQWSIKK